MLIFKRVYKKKKRKKKRLTKEEKMESVLRRKWGMEVKKLGNYTCCMTGITTKKRLIAHHLNSYHTHPEQRYDISNGVILEKTLHKKFHSQYGYKSTTKEQFLEFYTQEMIIMATKKKGKPVKKAEAKVPTGKMTPKPMTKGC